MPGKFEVRPGFGQLAAISSGSLRFLIRFSSCCSDLLQPASGGKQQIGLGTGSVAQKGTFCVTRLVAWFVLLFLTTTPRLCEASNNELLAGTAKVDITPPVGRQLWGQASRLGPSTGTLDPLYARVLVLKSTDTTLAIVALDLGRTFGLEQMGRRSCQSKSARRNQARDL